MSINSIRSARKCAGEVLACALLELRPDAQLSCGGVEGESFFCDIALTEPPSLKQVTKQMRRIIEEARPIKTLHMLRSNAAEYLQFLGQKQLAQKIASGSSEGVELIEIGEFRDLCPAPHLRHTGEIPPFALLDVSPLRGKWRFSGVAFAEEGGLKKFLQGRKKLIDAHGLGKERGLFSFYENERLWHPQGEVVREELTRWWQELQCGAHRVSTGLIPHKILFERETPPLPCGYAEIAPFERVTHFCHLEQVPSTLKSHLQAMLQVAKILSLGSQWSLWGAQASKARQEQIWKIALKTFEESKLSYFIETEPPNFPGLIISLQLTDRLGREWEGCQVHLEVRSDGLWQIQRTLFGALDIFVDRLLEHTHGVLPLWLAPEQVRVIPLTQEQGSQAIKVCELLRQEGMRPVLDCTKERLSARIRRSQLAGVPYVAVIGTAEGEGRLRLKRWNDETLFLLSFEELIERLKRECDTRGSIEDQ
ncbi:MAG: hypothetical protein JSR80_08275 [Verrucomicrobia bacterium]|nr:hypothetical protein [Verrucomicrobiota bacterium]